MKYGSRQRVRPKIGHLAPLDAAHAGLKNEFTDEKYHNLMSWLKCHLIGKMFMLPLVQYTIMILSIQTDRSSQTLSQVRLLLRLIQEQCGQGIHSLLFHLHLLDTLLYGKTTFSGTDKVGI